MKIENFEDIESWKEARLLVKEVYKLFIDCFGLLDDAKIRRYFELGCEVKGLGRGHVKRIKDSIRK